MYSVGLYRGWFDWSRRYSGCVSCACHVRIRFMHAYGYVREYTCCWCLWKNECSISRVQLLFSLSEPGHVFLSCCIFCSCLFSRLFSFFPYFSLIVFLYLFFVLSVVLLLHLYSAKFTTICPNACTATYTSQPCGRFSSRKMRNATRGYLDQCCFRCSVFYPLLLLFPSFSFFFLFFFRSN